MNKYQKALITVSKSCKALAMEFGFRKICDTEKTALNTLKQLVDKETPKKLKPFPNSFYIKTCPNCSLALETKRNYCDNCGQKLDWGDTNE